MQQDSYEQKDCFGRRMRLGDVQILYGMLFVTDNKK